MTKWREKIETWNKTKHCRAAWWWKLSVCMCFKHCTLKPRNFKPLKCNQRQKRTHFTRDCFTVLSERHAQVKTVLISLVQTVSPNQILCISGWNLIWITDCPHSVFTECALVSMVMPLRCYTSAKNNNNSNTICNTAVVLRHDNILPSRWIIIIMDFILWGSGRNAGSWNVRL